MSKWDQQEAERRARNYRLYQPMVRLYESALELAGELPDCGDWPLGHTRTRFAAALRDAKAAASYMEQTLAYDRAAADREGARMAREREAADDRKAQLVAISTGRKCVALVYRGSVQGYPCLNAAKYQTPEGLACTAHAKQWVREGKIGY